MAGRNIKIELELPDFEKELNITVTLQRDGEVLSCTSSSSEEINGRGNILSQDTQTCKVQEDCGNAWKQSAPPISSTPKPFYGGGNMMDINF